MPDGILVGKSLTPSARLDAPPRGVVQFSMSGGAGFAVYCGTSVIWGWRTAGARGVGLCKPS